MFERPSCNGILTDAERAVARPPHNCVRESRLAKALAPLENNDHGW